MKDNIDISNIPEEKETTAHNMECESESSQCTRDSKTKSQALKNEINILSNILVYPSFDNLPSNKKIKRKFLPSVLTSDR